MVQTDGQFEVGAGVRIELGWNQAVDIVDVPNIEAIPVIIFIVIEGTTQRRRRQPLLYVLVLDASRPPII